MAADHTSAIRAAKRWRQLIVQLMTSLHDGYSVDSPLRSTTLDVQKLFYPAWWLQKVGYYGPRYYPCYGPCATASLTALSTSVSTSDHAMPPDMARNGAQRFALAHPDASLGDRVDEETTPSPFSTSSSTVSRSAFDRPWPTVPVLLVGATAAAVFAAGVGVGFLVARVHPDGSSPATCQYELYTR